METDTLHITTWNVLCNSYLNPDYYPSVPKPEVTLNPRHRTALLHEIVTSIMPAPSATSPDTNHVLALQECDSDLATWLQSEYPVTHQYYAPRPDGKPDGTLLLSTLPLNDPHSLSTKDHRRANATAFITLPITGYIIQLASLHIDWDDPKEASSRGLTQLEETITYLNHPSRSPIHSTLLAGDLNTNWLTPKGEMLTEWDYQLLAPDPPTSPTATVDGRPCALDIIAFHRYASRNYTVLHNPSLPSHGTYPESWEPTPTPLFPSDHIPLHTTLHFIA